MNNITMTKTLLLCAALAVGAGAQAKNNGNNGNGHQQGNSQAQGATAGAASADDVTLDKADATSFAFSHVNPMQGAGNASGFDGTFATPATGAWTTLGTVTDKGATQDFTNLLDFSFTATGATTGTWTVTNASSTQNVTLDLVLAIHAAKASTAFLFDNQSVGAGQTLSGTWNIEWLNNGGQVPGFSNAVFFGGDMATSSVSPVPEPGVLPMMLSGFTLLGAAAAWRRRNRR